MIRLFFVHDRKRYRSFYLFSLVNLNQIDLLCGVHIRIDCYHESWRE